MKVNHPSEKENPPVRKESVKSDTWSPGLGISKKSKEKFANHCPKSNWLLLRESQTWPA